MSDDTPAFRDPPEAFVEHAEAASGVGVTLGEDPRALVHLTLKLRANHRHDDAAHYTAQLGIDPDLAQELGGYLLGAAKAARADLARYRATGKAR